MFLRFAVISRRVELGRFGIIVSMLVFLQEFLNQIGDVFRFGGLGDSRIGLPFVNGFQKLASDLILGAEDITIFLGMRLQQEKQEIFLK